MGRYDNAVVPRKEPFIQSTRDGEGADDLIRQLVVLREKFMRIGMVQTFHALDQAQLKAGFEYADHIRLCQRRLERMERAKARLNRMPRP